MYKVMENMQILEIQHYFDGCTIETSIGTAKEGTKAGEYEDITDILLPPPPPEPPKSSEVDLLKAEIEKLKADNITTLEALAEIYESSQGGTV